jgi:GNAT superfamily N-acetyltransferase
MHTDRVTMDDLHSLGRLQPEDWSPIIPDIEFYVKSDFCNPLKVTEANRIVGLGASILYGQTAWLAHIIVDPDFRNRGIGYHIVQNLLEDLESHSIETCLLTATEMGQPVYIRHGFRVVSEYVFLNRQSAWPELPFSPCVVQFSEAFRQDILALDRQITGENRERLVAPFLTQAMLYVRNNTLFGFYIPGLREGPVIAENEEAGVELLNYKYGSPNWNVPTMDKAVLPSENKTGIAFLKKQGFADSGKKGTRMILGRDVTWDLKRIFSRIGGNFG